MIVSEEYAVFDEDYTDVETCSRPEISWDDSLITLMFSEYRPVVLKIDLADEYYIWDPPRFP